MAKGNQTHGQAHNGSSSPLTSPRRNCLVGTRVRSKNGSQLCPLGPCVCWISLVISENLIKLIAYRIWHELWGFEIGSLLIAAEKAEGPLCKTTELNLLP